MIRNAVHADIPALVELAAPFFAASGMDKVAAWCPASLSASLSRMIDAPAAILLVAESDGVPVGLAGAMLFPAYWNAAVTVGQETFWWVLPEHRGKAGPAMLEAMEQAARDQGASAFLMVCLEAIKPEATGRLYQRRGYRPLEHSYWRPL